MTPVRPDICWQTWKPSVTRHGSRNEALSSVQNIDQRLYINRLGNRVVVLKNGWKNLEVNNILQNIFGALV